MLFALLLPWACAPLPLAGDYDYVVIAEEDTCGDIVAPVYGLGGGVAVFRVANVAEDHLDLTLVPINGEYDAELACSMSDLHFSCGMSFERPPGLTSTVAAGGAWLSEHEASLYWGMLQGCDSGTECTREDWCSTFSQFRITLNGIEQ
jgi:hypothetical protein